MANRARGHFSSNTNASNRTRSSRCLRLTSPECHDHLYIFRNRKKAHPPTLGHLAVLGETHSLEANPVLSIAEQLTERGAMSNETRGLGMIVWVVTMMAGLGTGSGPCCTDNQSPVQPVVFVKGTK